MDTNFDVKLAIGGVTFFTVWFALRLYARKYVNDLLYEEYEAIPDILGPVFASCASGHLLLKATPESTRGAIALLTDELLPMIGFNIPTEKAIVEFLAIKLSKPTSIPAKAIEPLLYEAIKYAMDPRDSDEFLASEIKLLIEGVLLGDTSIQDFAQGKLNA